MSKGEVFVLALVAAAFSGFVLGMILQYGRQMTARSRDDELLELVLWSTGDELWDMDLVNDSLKRTNALRHLQASSHERMVDTTRQRQLLHPDDRALFERAVTDHLKGSSECFDATYRAPDTRGQWRWLRSRGRVVERTPDGRALRMIGTTSDVTEAKEHEIEVELLNRELESRVRQRTEALDSSNRELQVALSGLQQAQDQLVHSEKMAALGGLVAGVAHEINTPLGIGVTAASHLESETKRLGLAMDAGSLTRDELERFRQTALESAQLILRNLMRADKLVRSFKQVAVDQSNEDRRQFDLAAYLQEVVISLNPALKKTPHRIELDAEAPLLLDSYPGAVYQIVANLVMNSLLHAFVEGQAGLIAISARSYGEQVVLDYRDDGRGMAEEVRKRIFEPFFTTRRGEGGSGLGMHIVWNLATQLLGGTIQCESAPGAGVLFRLRFPTVAPTAEAKS
jgi:C4-dicarboxylate-specific signal transduction histidine kinase